jgi:hypothetical protein
MMNKEDNAAQEHILRQVQEDIERIINQRVADEETHV